MEERESYAATEVFTPTSPARATFVERGTVNDKLVSALSTPGKQIVVYGHSGSGKTTLLINRSCPSVYVMGVIQGWEQMSEGGYAIQKTRWYTVTEEFFRGPHMIGDPSRHCRGNWAPFAR